MIYHILNNKEVSGSTSNIISSEIESTNINSEMASKSFIFERSEIISNERQSSSDIISTTKNSENEISSEIESTNINSEEASTENKLTDTNTNSEEAHKSESTIFGTDKSYISESLMNTKESESSYHK